MTRARSAGISGLALGMAALGGYAVYAGIHGVPFAAGLRSLIGSGKLPAPTPPKSTSVTWPGVDGGGGASADFGAAPGFGSDNAIAADARRYLGVPYVFGGHTPEGFDCSGLVTWVLHHDLGYELPNDTHTVTGEFYVWTGAKTIDKSQCDAGDLVCWLGHIGIATGPKTMIHAPMPGEVVKESSIWWTPEPLIRRPIQVQRHRTDMPG